MEDQARGFSRVAAAPYPCLLLAVSFFVGWRLTPYPTYGPCHCELKISTLSLWLLKLPVLAASTSLRRSLQAGAARRDAG
ncbi:hypothetical protein NUKP86_01130 [Klebsiella variicola]|nr:hypothetical protein NUKP86_01130 [Klebsiella variicola]